jgi:hypothetical protein
MAEMHALCRDGLQALDAALDPARPPEHDVLARATRCIAGYRDHLIERTREGDANARSLLRQTNALLSEIVAAEFPLVGVRRDRIKQAREDYQKLVSAG